jgi:general secretion pathway protein F
MADFLWKAARNNAELVEGHTQADSQAQVTLQLRAQGLTPLAIVLSEPGSATTAQLAMKMHAKQDLHSGGFFASKAITRADILIMTSELSIMLNAGLALDNALRVLIGMSVKPAMAALVQSVLDEVKSGVPLSRVLARHPDHFGDFYVHMVHSGEASGQLSAVLERLNEHLERLSSLRESVISASMYPLILFGVAILSMVAMMGFVVPQFETLFKGMGDALPVPTRIVMNLGSIFTIYGPIIGLISAAVVLLLRQWLRSPSGRKWWQTRALGIPIAGKLLLKYDLTLYARSLGTLLGNGVPLLQALHIATQTVGNINLRNALASVAPHVKGGGKMVDAMKSCGIFEPLALSLVKVGEETGRVGPMLLELARIFNRDVENGIKRGLTLLEPVLILVLGLMIAAIIVSILLGILSINDLAV